MSATVIADTGALVALIDKREQHHEWAKAQAQNLIAPFLTCEAVITEACFLLASVHGGKQVLLSYLSDDILQIDFTLQDEVGRVAQLMERYENVPMAFADACLVRMSEQYANSIVFTLDTDFWIYRRNDKDAIELVIPE